MEGVLGSGFRWVSFVGHDGGAVAQRVEGFRELSFDFGPFGGEEEEGGLDRKKEGPLVSHLHNCVRKQTTAF